ncbi:hypothetical protein TNCV_2903791 [Trichonephila clavipes]|nr:hypothetical protein TNCV_2903791 [Trichonephila clavipes]
MHYGSHLSCHHPQRSMERFTNTELADLHLIYRLAGGNARAADRVHHESYPQRDASDCRMFANLLSEYGSLRGSRHNEGGTRISTCQASPSTIQKRLLKVRHKATIAKKKQFPVQKKVEKNRLAWAKISRSWTVND